MCTGEFEKELNVRFTLNSNLVGQKTTGLSLIAGSQTRDKLLASL
jgi:hypothetical protein